MADVEVVGTCRVCGGGIVRVAQRVYRGDPVHRIIGPGGRNQTVAEVNLHCEDCGVQYAKLPKESS